MADQVTPRAGVSSPDTPAPVSHQEFYTASDGSRWMMQIEVRWTPRYESHVSLFRMPQQTPVSLPPNLPYLEVVPPDLRSAALDGRFDLDAITRYCVRQCLSMLRDYVERFGVGLQ